MRNAQARFSREKQIIKDNVLETLSPEDDIDDVTREVHENDSDDQLSKCKYVICDNFYEKKKNTLTGPDEDEVHQGKLATTMRNVLRRFSREKQIIKDNVQETLSPEDDIDDVTREVHENDSDDQLSKCKYVICDNFYEKKKKEYIDWTG